MVFVSELLFIALLVLVSLFYINLIFVTYFLSDSDRLSYKPRYSTKLYSYKNILYMLFLIYAVLLNVYYINGIALILFFYITYKQPYVWVSSLENMIFGFLEEVRDKTLQALVIDNYIITSRNVLTYISLTAENVVKGFAQFREDLVNDVKGFFGLYDGSWKERVRLDKMWDKMRKLFDSKTLGRDTRFDHLNPEQLEEVYERLKKSYDPNIMFNKLQRLPIYLTYDTEYQVELDVIVKGHLIVIYNFFKTTLVALLLSLLYFIYTVFFFKIQFLKQLAVWFVIGMLYFWLMSGFNFFVKRYQFGKFTSQIQRFWKRTNMCFWLIEGFLILLFFYYFLNSSQEPLYMYDYSALNQEFLVSLQVVFINIVLLATIIYLMYFTLLRINSNSWTQLTVYLGIISVFIFFSFFIETYQFYYVISSFNERLWIFNEEENLWTIDTESPILRTKHQYLLVCLIAKYWHFLFIFLSWVFFLIKSFEKRKVTYVLFGANLQNVILLYVLNFACYIQWFKWLYRRFFDLPYTWFFTSIDNKFFFRLFSEIKLLISSTFNTHVSVTYTGSSIYKSLSLWGVDSLALWKFIE